MPLQNRVTPAGDIVAVAARGTMMGNRGGALHGPERTLGRRRWVSRQWICCSLEFRARHRTVMQPGRYTELFFLDEATALAAGHRPCFECRRAEFLRFADRFTDTAVTAGAARAMAPRPRAEDIDRALHAERLDAAGRKRVVVVPLDDLPDGCMIVTKRFEGPHLVAGAHLIAWTHHGYVRAIQRPRGSDVEALTPPSIIDVLRRGYRPLVHPSAAALIPAR